ncbi:MAG TPA: ABC transporter permease [Cyclobacteriaceae bacterium]|nr:ABC transporter permease [Cyclobacteriaceae bacterium]
MCIILPKISIILKLSYFISKRILKQDAGGFSSTAHKIAVASISIGLAAALVAFMILTGFQNTVKNKIYAFSAHLLVSKYTMSNAIEEQPFYYNIPVFTNPEELPFITHVQEYSHKAGLIKTDEELMGIIFKGIGMRFDSTGFSENMLEGRFIQFPDSSYSNEVVISKIIADKLRLERGDDIIVHFFQNPPRVRRLNISGIYETNLSEYFDSKIILGDIRLIQRLNQWADSIAGGLEVFIKNPNESMESAFYLSAALDYDLYVTRVADKYQQVFEWLELISRQVNILLAVILIVVCINMVSIIIILVMERTQMVGLLKALGSKDSLIRGIFAFSGMRLIARGLLFGNTLGLGLCFLQYKFQWIKLNPTDYYMSYVPIDWNWEAVILLNILTFTIVTLVLLIPTLLISGISPIRAMRFD